MSNYQKYPSITVRGWENIVVSGYEAIMKKLYEEYKIGDRTDYCIVFDTYPGVYDEEILESMKLLNLHTIIDMKQIFKAEEVLTEQLKYNLTDDRVFGKMYYGQIEDLMDMKKLEQLKEQVIKSSGLTVVYGFGAREYTFTIM